MQLITGTADFIRHFPPMSAVGARQHPQQGPCLPAPVVEAAVVVAVGKRVAERHGPQPACSGREECESGFNARACGGCP